MVFPTHIVAVGGVVENNKGEILLVKQRNNGEWVYPGGQVEVGETIIEALIREVREESGINISVDKLFWIGSNIAGHKGYDGVDNVPTKVIFGFICSYIDGELCDSDETSEARWVKKENVLDMIPLVICDRFQAYLDFNGTVQYTAYTSKPYELKSKRNI